jgi:hypothetical protein
MKNTFTTLETLTTHDGNTIIFNQMCVGEFFKTIFEQNYLKLSPEEKEEVYLVNQQYGDLLNKLWREPLQEALKPSGAKWATQDEKRNAMQEYKHALSVAKDADITEEAHQIKMERLKLHAELFAKK